VAEFFRQVHTFLFDLATSFARSWQHCSFFGMASLWTVVLFSHSSVNQLEHVLVEVIDKFL
jgi:hypothetical protein